MRLPAFFSSFFLSLSEIRSTAVNLQKTLHNIYRENVVNCLLKWCLTAVGPFSRNTSHIFIAFLAIVYHVFVFQTAFFATIHSFSVFCTLYKGCLTIIYVFVFHTSKACFCSLTVFLSFI